VDVLAPPVGLSGCASGWPSCTIPYLGLGSQGNNGALLSSASLPELLFLFIFFYPSSLTREFFVLAHHDAVACVSHSLLSLLAVSIYTLLFHQLVGCLHSFLRGNGTRSFFRRYKLDYYTFLPFIIFLSLRLVRFRGLIFITTATPLRSNPELHEDIVEGLRVTNSLGEYQLRF
jgi:hypothetical protein